ncbi:MAG: ferrous iron transport protein B [Desulfamplus sp.]|nr:ferrous iron transport protein B [Desulfamplus sp.]
METTIALAGNPNSGKTTLFNALTGAHQHVGNYPGVTVEKKCGTFTFDDKRFNVVDLPGTYSLTAYSLEEVVARDFLALEKPDMVINIVDASNLERNLYLSLQIMEMGLPVCIALNMMDVAKKRGITIDIEKLSKLLGVPIAATVARDGKKGAIELIETISKIFDTSNNSNNQQSNSKINHNHLLSLIKISYGNDIDNAILDIEKIVNEYSFLTDKYPSRWVALKFLENDEQIIKLAQKHGDLFDRVLCDTCKCDPNRCNIFKQISQRCDTKFIQKISQIVTGVSEHLQQTEETYPEAVIADRRYGYINSLLKQGVVHHHYDSEKLRTSDKIDKVLTHRFLGPAIMVAIIYSMYHFTFAYSELPVSWLEGLFGLLSSSVDSIMADGLVKSLVISGVIDGVGGVLGFVPLIMFMFFFIAILEDSGYLARVAYMLDRVFRVFGLHGSSVMPFIISGGIAGGCAVPGIMATRTLKSPKERLATLLTVPFMNCGAKLPVFILLIAAFFQEHRAFFMFLITLIAWIGALAAAKLFRSTIIKGQSTPFVMELPSYRLPTFTSLLIHTWERTWQYIKKAGTVILGISIVLWAMMTFPSVPADIQNKTPETALKYSIAGRIGSSIENITQFAGFDWRINIALLGGFAAKEVVVSTLGTAYSLSDVDPEQSDTLAKQLSNSPDFRPLTAISLIIFTMFYSPCFVAVVCISRESGSWRWGLFSILFNTTFAFTFAVIIYQLGSMMGF